nr:hypothetical protein [Tanacetum cinerariifolium]
MILGTLCDRAAAVEMVTGGNKGVSGVACRGLNRSGRWGVFWSSPKKNLRRRRRVVAAGGRLAGEGERRVVVCVLFSAAAGGGGCVVSGVAVVKVAAVESSFDGDWCSGGAGCRRAAAVEMVTGGSKGVSGVACRGLNRSGRWGVFWSSLENFRRKKKSPTVASCGGSRRPTGWGGRERSSSVCIIL